MHVELAVDFYGTSIKQYFKSLKFFKQLCISLLFNGIFSFLFLLAVTSVVKDSEVLPIAEQSIQWLKDKIQLWRGSQHSTIRYTGTAGRI